MRRGEAAILAELTQFRSDVSGRFDRIESRLDTLIDAVAELRHDFDTHTHDGGEA